MRTGSSTHQRGRSRSFAFAIAILIIAIGMVVDLRRYPELATPVLFGVALGAVGAVLGATVALGIIAHRRLQ